MRRSNCLATAGAAPDFSIFSPSAPTTFFIFRSNWSAVCPGWSSAHLIIRACDIRSLPVLPTRKTDDEDSDELEELLEDDFFFFFLSFLDFFFLFSFLTFFGSFLLFLSFFDFLTFTGSPRKPTASELSDAEESGSFRSPAAIALGSGAGSKIRPASARSGLARPLAAFLPWTISSSSSSRNLFSAWRDIDSGGFAPAKRDSSGVSTAAVMTRPRAL